LKDHAHLPLVSRHKGSRRGCVDDVPVIDDLTGVAAFEADDRSQCGRLAAAARPKQRQDLAATDLKAQSIDGANGTELLGDVMELEYQ
jgi:hypothetical protein